MFTSTHPALAPKNVRALINDPSKMVAMIDGLSEFLADVLQIVDRELDSTDPFVEVMRQEIHHYPSHNQKREMELLHAQYQFVLHCEDLAERMRKRALYACGPNLDLFEFANEKGGQNAYYYDDEVIQMDVTTTTVPVGGVGQRLMRHLATLAMAWLQELDKALCTAGGIERSDAVTRELHNTQVHLAWAIARRLTVMSHDSVSDDGLSARALQRHVAEQYSRTRLNAQAYAKRDVAALSMLRVLATDPQGKKAHDILQNELRTMTWLVRNLPPEMAIGMANANAGQLARAMLPDQDIEVRVALTTFWADNYGHHAVACIDLVLKQLQEWTPVQPEQFPKLVVQSDVRCKNVVAMPSTSAFLYMDRSQGRLFLRKGPTARRTGLDELGERTVRLVNTVWEVSAMMLQPGTVACEPVVQIATECMLLARMGAKMLNNKRETENKGFKLDAFLANLFDAQGDHASTIRKASCALSRFRLDELEATFHSEGEILPRISNALATRTRSRMHVRLDPEYTSFATDAIAFLLPLVHQQRDQAGLSPAAPSNWLADLLSVIPRASRWQPSDGTLRLTLEDLAVGHRSTREVLDALDERGLVVRREGGSTKGKHKKITYAFDSMALMNIFPPRVKVVSCLK